MRGFLLKSSIQKKYKITSLENINRAVNYKVRQSADKFAINFLFFVIDTFFAIACDSLVDK